MNKIFASFVFEKDLDVFVSNLISSYQINNDKIFVLNLQNSNELLVTYSIDSTNLNFLPMKSFLVHKKKETNTLYTLNALNELIRLSNGGIVDTSFNINWNHYKNCILLTQNGNFKSTKTNLYKIIKLN